MGTPRHRLDAELAELALEAADTAVAIADAALTVTYVNGAFLRLWGFEREEQVLGRSATEFWKDAPAAEGAARELLRSGRWEGELDAGRADGSGFAAKVTANVFHRTAPASAMLVATFVDVTAQRAAELALRRVERIGRIGSWSIEPATGEVAWSAEVARIFGIPSEEPPSLEGFLSRVHPEDRQRVTETISGESAGVGITFRIVTPHGERVVHGIGERSPGGGSPPRLEGTVQDVTARARLEEQLRQAQKMEAVGLLAGGVAHDFNNLLTVILSGAEFLEEALAPGDPRKADADQILAAARKAETLTRQLLAFSRRQVLRPGLLDPNQVVSGVSKMIRRLIGADVEVALALAGAPPCVHADPSLLEQALMNLVVNARDAMPGGGRLDLATGVRELDAAEAERLAVVPGRYVALTVTDTGHGMDEATRARIFEPFFTTKPPGRGSGLGLSTVYGIARQAAGCVDVRSRPGEGASFAILLPAKGGAATGQGELASPSTTRGAGRVVLIAEDEPAVRAVAERCLRQRGYVVYAAPDGESALRIAAGLPEIHLLLTDVVMPRLDGRQLAEAFRAIHRRTPVLFMTGYTDDTALRLGIETNQVRILSKPFTPDGLASAVEEAMASGSEAPASPAARVKTSG